MLNCILELSEVPLHLYQIIAGFYLLDKSGEIKLKINRLSADDSRRLPYNMLRLNAGDMSLVYDMNDGYDNLPMGDKSVSEFYDDILSGCDMLFKRSFNAEINSGFSEPQKIRKTAPNFFVTTKGNPAHFPLPCDERREQIKKLVRMLPFSEYYNGWCYEKNFRCEPSENKNPRALFMARLWDPAGDFPGQLSEEKSEERHIINVNRAECIRLCRREFGDSFFGGIAPSEFSQREYPDLVLENSSISKKNEYLDFMKTFDIHIATMGLHRSTGWKFAEYLAASRAIVTEPLFYESIGELAPDKNYLLFETASECAEKINELFDSGRRLNMMNSNKEYRDRYMGCESIASDTLTEAGLLKR